MLHNKSERVLLVAANIFSIELTGNKLIKHVSSVDRVFPAIYEMAPHIIVFDYDFLSADMEKILRRIRTNSYYNKIKICCFKRNPDRKIDSFLKLLGVNHVIYKDELANPDKAVVNHINSIIDAKISDWLTKASL